MSTAPKPRRFLDDWEHGDVVLDKIPGYAYPGSGATAYAVTYKGTFLGYVAGRDGGWSAQPEDDPSVGVWSTYKFVFGGMSRNQVVGDLLHDARMAGVIV